MTFATAQKFKTILTGLSILRYILKSSGATGTTDAYKYSERFFETILNYAFNLKLKNMNEMAHNYPAIDLGDKINRVCFQVTGENSSGKIQDTIDKFFKNNLDSEYDCLKFLILTTKKTYSKKFTFERALDFEIKRDVLDVDDVLKKIEIGSADSIGVICDFVERELESVLRNFAPPKSLMALAEPRINRPSLNLLRLIEYLEVDPDEVDELRKTVRRGYKKLTSLSKELREYIYLILTRGNIVSSFGEKIAISPIVIEGLLKFSRERSGEYYSVIQDLGFADIPEGELAT